MQLTKEQESILRNLIQMPDDDMIDTITISRKLVRDEHGYRYEHIWHITAERKNSTSVHWIDEEEGKLCMAYEPVEPVRYKEVEDFPF